MLGLFEPVCAPWKVERRPGRLLVRRAAARLGPDGALPREGDGAASRSSAEVGHPEVLLRPGELHARPAAGRRRGARAAQLLRRRRAELDRHPHRRRHRPGAGALDRRRPPRRRRHRHQHRPAAHATRPTRSTARTRTVESLGHGLPVPLPDPVDADGARRQACRRCTTGWSRSGAYFRDVSGWEGADWYAGPGRRRRIPGR